MASRGLAGTVQFVAPGGARVKPRPAGGYHGQDRPSRPMPVHQALNDYHVHTARCGHAVGRMEEYVAQARRAGLPEMGFSDHLYLYWQPLEVRDPELAMGEEELDAYVEDVLRLRR